MLRLFKLPGSWLMAVGIIHIAGQFYRPHSKCSSFHINLTQITAANILF